MNYAPTELHTPSSQVASAVSKYSAAELLTFAQFSDLEGVRRGNLFEFEEISRAQVNWQLREEPQPATAAPSVPVEPVVPPAPGPDAEGLQLIGTVAGNDRAFALILDTQPTNPQAGGKPETRVFNLGDTIRESKLTEILADSIVLTRNSESVVVALPDLSGQTNSPSVRKVSSNQNRDTAATRPSQNAQSSNNQARRRALSQSTATADRPKARLGLAGRFIKGYGLQKYNLKSPALFVQDVEHSDAAIQPNDVIIYIDNQKFKSGPTLLSIIEKKFSGDSVSVRLLRDEKPMTVEYILP